MTRRPTPVDVLRCPLCTNFGVRYGSEMRTVAIDGAADHLAFCADDTHRTDRRLTRQLEQEQTP